MVRQPNLEELSTHEFIHEIEVQDQPQLIELTAHEFIQRARTGAPLAIGIGLIIFGLLPLVAIWIVNRGMQFQLDNFVALTLLGTFVFVTVETFAIILLQGFHELELPEKFLHWLGGATIGEVATLLTIIVRAVFKGH